MIFLWRKIFQETTEILLNTKYILLIFVYPTTKRVPSTLWANNKYLLI